MLHPLDCDQHIALPRRRPVQSLASTKQSALLLEKSPHHWLCWPASRRTITERRLKNIEKLAFASNHLTTTASAPLEEQAFSLSTRFSNSK